MIRENVVFCDICNSAFVELNRKALDTDYYLCTMCRENGNEKYNHVGHNIINNKEVVDYGNI